MSLDTFFSTLQLGLVYSVLALGLFLSFRILNTPDLTVDGSFVTGMAISAVLALAGHPAAGAGSCLCRRQPGRRDYRTLAYTLKNSADSGGDSDDDGFVFGQPENNERQAESFTL